MQDGLDGGLLASSFTTQIQSKSPSLIMACSAGGCKGPPDLNHRYFLDTGSALCDAMIRYSFFTHVARGLEFAEIDII